MVNAVLVMQIFEYFLSLLKFDQVFMKHYLCCLSSWTGFLKLGLYLALTKSLGCLEKAAGKDLVADEITGLQITGFENHLII